MLTQKPSKAKSTGATTLKHAEKIMDKKTKRKYKKMFKQTTRRKQRLIEKQETRRIIHEYDQDQWEDDHNERTKYSTGL
ncbi:hypothetical protein [Evansella clarkii]|uniref:hypothetical protein n=1 Tax=Evansella clarkii TaxID=79879 RepID=UPI001473D84D|nr:hypothetical protein [Evansella clarkii]